MSESKGRAVTWICFCVAMVDGYDTLLFAFIAPLISKEWHLTPTQIGQIFAISYAGAAVGAIVTGFAADLWGRRGCLLVALALAGGATLTCSQAADANQLMALRCIAGFGLGGAIPTLSAITAAFALPDDRSAAVTRMFLGYPIGALIGGALTAGFLAFAGWRGVFIGAGLVTCCLVPVAGILLPDTDSPRRRSGNSEHRLIGAVLGSGYLAGTVVLCTSTFLILLVTYFLVSWTPSVLVLNGIAPPQAALATVVLNLGGLIGAYVLSTFLRQRGAGRIVGSCLLVGSLLTATLGVAITMGVAIAFACALAVGVFIIGAQSNLPALAVRFYSPAVCATGVGVCMSCGRLGSIVGPLAGGYLATAQIGWSQLFAIAAVPASLAGIALILWERGRQHAVSSSTKRSTSPRVL